RREARASTAARQGASLGAEARRERRHAHACAASEGGRDTAQAEEGRTPACGLPHVLLAAAGDWPLRQLRSRLTLQLGHDLIREGGDLGERRGRTDEHLVVAFEYDERVHVADRG